MNDKKQAIVVKTRELSIVQELKIGTESITQIGVARHEARLIAMGKDLGERHARNETRRKALQA